MSDGTGKTAMGAQDLPVEGLENNLEGKGLQTRMVRLFQQKWEKKFGMRRH